MKKSFVCKLILLSLLVMCMVMTASTMVMADTGTSPGSTILGGIFLSLATSGLFQGVLLTILLGGVGGAILRFKWAKEVVEIGIDAYKFAEQEGLVQQLKGYAKFGPFMDKFIAEYQAKYGTTPSPSAKAIATKAMERQVLISKAIQIQNPAA